jgi:2-haloacid dehalogenase
MTRREFVVATIGGLSPAVSGSIYRAMTAAQGAARSRINAIAFDALALFDPRTVLASADALFPEAGLGDEWRTRQFEYTWLRIAAQSYADFWEVTNDALVFAANRLKLPLSADGRAALMNEYLSLPVWPDVVPALQSIRQSGVRLALLSNFTAPMLDANIQHAGLAGVFEQVVSTDKGKTYKPDPRAYQLGVDALKTTRDEVLFVAFAGWDAAGAKLFGYPTFWVNRQRNPPEELGVLPDGSGDTLIDLVSFLPGIFPAARDL